MENYKLELAIANFEHILWKYIKKQTPNMTPKQFRAEADEYLKRYDVYPDSHLDLKIIAIKQDTEAMRKKL